jgi:uncharacterized protein YfaS (alpha-2-macroglobulin family)
MMQIKSSSNKQHRLKRFRQAAVIAVAVASACNVETSEAFMESLPQHRITNHPAVNGLSNAVTALNYAMSNHPSSKGVPMSSQSSRGPSKQINSRSTMPLSNSVLSDSDTLPAFPTAHGLLSPETVMRMEIMTMRGRDKALDTFLDTYKKDGPMACLPMLSDKNILPRLTEAMRDIIS